jgi:prepilin-type processing-associated H-X9-DG protein
MKLGLRKLTDSDLGLADNATTHIGLYAGVLTFLKDEAVQHSYVIYNKSYYEMTSWFDRIIRGGEPSTPKIRTGKSEISVVSLIRNIAGENKGNPFKTESNYPRYYILTKFSNEKKGQLYPWHNDSICNVLFFDGHVQSYSTPGGWDGSKYLYDTVIGSQMYESYKTLQTMWHFGTDIKWVRPQ